MKHDAEGRKRLQRITAQTLVLARGDALRPLRNTSFDLYNPSWCRPVPLSYGRSAIIKVPWLANSRACPNEKRASEKQRRRRNAPARGPRVGWLHICGRANVRNFRQCSKSAEPEARRQ